jgi:hypothetical protein
VYGWKHGFGRGWLPHRLQVLIVSVVNFVCCRLWGHDVTLRSIPESQEDDGSYRCTMCCKKLWDK